MLRKTLETADNAESQIDLAAESVTKRAERVRRLTQITDSEKARFDLNRERLELVVAESDLALARAHSQRCRWERVELERLQNALHDRPLCL